MTTAGASPRPADRADTVTRDILAAIHRGDPALVIDSPPGAGKTTTGLKIAATAWGLHRESVMVACWTNRQAIDFAVRMASTYSKIPVQLFLKEELVPFVPPGATRLRNLRIVSKTTSLTPTGVAVSNASKWVAYPLGHVYEWLIVDEAYQLPDFKFHLLVPLARRFILVGDPGQIAPLIQADVSPWGCDPAGPHVPCPEALLARHPTVPTKQLPVSWRLPSDSARVVRTAFYDFDFGSGDPDNRRRLRVGTGNGAFPDRVIQRSIDAGASLVCAVLPAARIATDQDDEIAQVAADLSARLLARNTSYFDDVREAFIPLRASDIGVVTAHRAQVAEIEKRLRASGVPCGPSDVVVETTERWQGLERPVMVVHHPLAGIDRLSSFDLDRGRLCVMLSRHRVACFLIGRANIGEAIDMHVHTGDRFAGTPDDEHLGWKANAEVWGHLRAAGTIVGA